MLAVDSVFSSHVRSAAPARHPAGNTRHPTRVRAVPLHDPDGTVRGWLGLNADLEDSAERPDTREPASPLPGRLASARGRWVR
ncbi:hypothetical protein SAMN05660642_04060 [Geodermatophilus siccatus]|uniref:Uncharacterized protein n=1 Tax=Geodermatophilus siccatus TaxID=1137991 RepID=A0A1G9YPD7_9ACTN|nr:hypothetical protein [Geodermatophilus siccatus]SDN10837.1 hypothetical protein SAMN05660642_04060 [Geodermatophilus siccatus]